MANDVHDENFRKARFRILEYHFANNSLKRFLFLLKFEKIQIDVKLGWWSWSTGEGKAD